MTEGELKCGVTRGAAPAASGVAERPGGSWGELSASDADAGEERRETVHRDRATVVWGCRSWTLEAKVDALRQDSRPDVASRERTGHNKEEVQFKKCRGEMHFMLWTGGRFS